VATGYDPRVVKDSPCTYQGPLNTQRVIEAGERMLAQYDISPGLRAQIEANLERLRG